MGFFSPTLWAEQRQPLQLVPDCATCKLDRGCQSPYMPVDGGGARRVLILAEAPGKNEDEQGKPLVGAAGREEARLLASLGVDLRRDCWLTNALRCRPPGNRAPESREVQACRPNLAKTLRDLKPDIVIPLGQAALASLIALAWRPGEVDSVTTWVGWQIPSQRLACWICPSFHPSHLLHKQAERPREAPLLESVMLGHRRRAFAHRGPPPRYDFAARCRVEMDAVKAATAVDALVQNAQETGIPLAFDLETTTLRPEGDHAAILCCSVADGATSVAFPWTPETAAAVRRLALAPVAKIGAMAKFEERWLRKKLGVAVRGWDWDVVLGAHWGDCRGGITSVKFQSFVRFGVEDYDYLIDAYKSSRDRGCHVPNRLREVEPDRLMFYCAMDSILEWHIAAQQKEVLKR